MATERNVLLSAEEHGFDMDSDNVAITFDHHAILRVDESHHGSCDLGVAIQQVLLMSIVVGRLRGYEMLLENLLQVSPIRKTSDEYVIFVDQEMPAREAEDFIRTHGILEHVELVQPLSCEASILPTSKCLWILLQARPDGSSVFIGTDVGRRRHGHWG